MTPIMQTSYGKGKGNCLTACVASLLDLPITAVPEFCIDSEWFDRLATFCQDNGFGLLYWKHKKHVPILAIGCYIIVCLQLEGTDELHAVIGKTKLESKEKQENGEFSWGWGTDLIHDPNEYKVPPIIGVDHYILIFKQ